MKAASSWQQQHWAGGAGGAGSGSWGSASWGAERPRSGAGGGWQLQPPPFVQAEDRDARGWKATKRSKRGGSWVAAAKDEEKKKKEAAEAAEPAEAAPGFGARALAAAKAKCAAKKQPRGSAANAMARAAALRAQQVA